MYDCAETQFNPLDVYGYSVENELGYSKNCIPNLLKLIVFGIYLLIFFFLMLYALTGLAREYSRHTAWNSSKRRFASIVGTAAVHVALFSIWITGTFSRGKYVLFPLIYWLICLSGPKTIQELYTASVMIKRSGNALSEEHQNRLNYLYYSFQVYQTIGYLLFWGVLPMVFFDDPYTLNWVYIIGYVHSGIVCLLVSGFGFRVASTIIETIKPKLEINVSDRKISVFLEQLETLIKKLKISAAITSPSLLLVLWVALTQHTNNPGLDYFFYFEFFVNVPSRVLICAAVTKAAWKDLDSIGHGSSSGSSKESGSESERKKSKDFSFTPDELNAKDGVVEMSQK